MLLDIKHLVAGYGKRRVIEDFNLHVDQGEVVSLLGPNGGGKTTLLRAITGLADRMAGTIAFNGSRIERSKTDAISRFGLGMVPEGRGILSKLTVRENLRLGMAARPRASLRARLEDIFGVFPPLEQFVDSLAGDLSGGQQQMLAIARALMSEPRLLMVDEMSFGLSPAATQALLSAISNLRGRDFTFLLVDQDVSALKISDRTYVIGGGKITLEGTSSELMNLGRDRLARVYLGVNEDTRISER